MGIRTPTFCYGSKRTCHLYYHNYKSVAHFVFVKCLRDKRLYKKKGHVPFTWKNDESPLTSVTSVPSNTDYTHDVSFSSAQTLNVTRNPLSAMNMFQNATISGGNITFNLVQQQWSMTISNCSRLCLTTPLRHFVSARNDELRLSLKKKCTQELFNRIYVWKYTINMSLFSLKNK